jgi:hypothetical protein
VASRVIGLGPFPAIAKRQFERGDTDSDSDDDILPSGSTLSQAPKQNSPGSASRSRHATTTHSLPTQWGAGQNKTPQIIECRDGHPLSSKIHEPCDNGTNGKRPKLVATSVADHNENRENLSETGGSLKSIQHRSMYLSPQNKKPQSLTLVLQYCSMPKTQVLLRRTA